MDRFDRRLGEVVLPNHRPVHEHQMLGHDIAGPRHFESPLLALVFYMNWVGYNCALLTPRANPTSQTISILGADTPRYLLQLDVCPPEFPVKVWKKSPFHGEEAKLIPFECGIELYNAIVQEAKPSNVGKGVLRGKFTCTREACDKSSTETESFKPLSGEATWEVQIIEETREKYGKGHKIIQLWTPLK